MTFDNLEELLVVDLELCCRLPNRNRTYDVNIETFEDALNDGGVIINPNAGPQIDKKSFAYRMRYEGMTLVVVTASRIEVKDSKLVYQESKFINS
jgi:hypothetical protein